MSSPRKAFSDVSNVASSPVSPGEDSDAFEKRPKLALTPTVLSPVSFAATESTSVFMTESPTGSTGHPEVHGIHNFAGKPEPRSDDIVGVLARNLDAEKAAAAASSVHVLARKAEQAATEQVMAEQAAAEQAAAEQAAAEQAAADQAAAEQAAAELAAAEQAAAERAVAEAEHARFMEVQDGVIRDLQALYRGTVGPLEERYHFRTDADVQASSLVLVLGQYSTGKTSFIRRVLRGEAYEGSRIGPEPTTDCFNAIVHDGGAAGAGRRRKEGQIATRPGQVKGDGFTGLAKFGERFLNGFQVRAAPQSDHWHSRRRCHHRLARSSPECGRTLRNRRPLFFLNRAGRPGPALLLARCLLQTTPPWRTWCWWTRPACCRARASRAATTLTRCALPADHAR